MSRSTFSEARTGRKAFKGRGNSAEIVETLKYEIGETKRVIVPIVDGKVVVFSTPIHKVLNSRVRLPKNAGGTYPVNEIRCTHVSTQPTDAESLRIAKKGEMCVFCELAKLENRQQWDIIRNEYGDSFKEMSKEEKKAIFNRIQSTHTVESTFIEETDDDGNTILSHTSKSYLLVLEVETTGNDGKKVALDGSGKPIVSPKLFPITATRSTKFKDAVETALDMETLQRENLYPYIENEGTNLEEEVLIGWVDFMLKFPRKSTKMESAKDLTILATSSNNSIVSDELIEFLQPKLEKMVKDAEFTTNNFFKNLKEFSRAEAIEFIADAEDENGNVISGEEYLDNLRAKYLITESTEDKLSDVERETALFAKTIERLEGTGNATETVEKPAETPQQEVQQEVTETAETTEETVETPAEEAPKKAKRVVRKKPAPKEEEVLDEDAFADEDFEF